MVCNNLFSFNKRTIGCEEMGKPYSTETKSDSIVLQWKQVTHLSDKTYQVMYKEIPNGKWRLYVIPVECIQPKMKIAGLRSNTAYVFKVWTVDETTGQHGPYSEESDAITTKTSPAIGLLKNEQLIVKGPPHVYRLPIKEIISERNDTAKTRKFYLGNIESYQLERTLMFVGSIGSGKSTLINCFANYLMGVTWKDDFRFSLVGLEFCDEKNHNQALSQTEWVTCYTLHNSVSDRVNYSVNLIDTPGFEDNRGLEHDQKIVEQIRQLLTSRGEKGLLTLDAVCFVLKASDARLTITQRYIFESIMSLFGKDIQENICTLITFADMQYPPVLEGIRALDGHPLPYNTYFAFNNSALYADNSDNASTNLTFSFWDLAIKGCDTFFAYINKMQTKSLILTSKVLRIRAKLETTVLKRIMGLSNVGLLKKGEEESQRTFTHDQEQVGIDVMMEVITKLHNQLTEIELRPDPLSNLQYIDLMIASEQREKRSGFESRIEALHKYKQRATHGE